MVNQDALRLLEYLKESQKAVSGTALARQWGISRVALWKRFERLRAAGYPVVADRSGYRLLPSDKPLPWEFPAGKNIYHFDTVGSTMDEAFRLALDGLSEGAVIAERQSAGRGRDDRRWESDGGNLLVTLILRPSLPMALLGALGLEALAALADTLLSLYGLDLKLKWPNDLVSNGRKVAGVLVEACGPAERPRFYTVGLGLNVHSRPDLDRPVASVEGLGHPQADRRIILADWRGRLAKWCADPALHPARWLALAVKPRRTTLKAFDGENVCGVPQGFDRSGSLLLARGEEIIPIRYGEARTQGVFS